MIRRSHSDPADEGQGRAHESTTTVYSLGDIQAIGDGDKAAGLGRLTLRWWKYKTRGYLIGDVYRQSMFGDHGIWV